MATTKKKTLTSATTQSDQYQINQLVYIITFYRY